MDTASKSSFMRREVSKEDAIIQLLRPQVGARLGNTLDAFERFVTEAETLTKLGVKLRAGGKDYFITPTDLKANLDEFGELEQLAIQGRRLLTDLGYVSPRKNMPILAGAAPVGGNVEVRPIEVTLPGSDPVSGAVISPKAHGKQTTKPK